MPNEKLNVFGGTYKLSELRRYVADLATVAGVKPYTLSEGVEKGVFAVDVRTGSGLEYSVVPDKGMNICNLKYCGIPLDWSSGTGLTSPFAYEPQQWGWLRSFNGGVVHTCGLDNVGECCVDQGPMGQEERFGGHGRISNTPAREVSWSVDTDRAPYEIYVSGTCRSVSVQGENLLLKRRVLSRIGAKSIIVKDTVCNLGHLRTPIFLLYHCNFGFPLVCEEMKLSIPAERAIDPQGQDVPDFERIPPPSDSTEEQVFYPLLDNDSVEVSLVNRGLGRDGLGVYLKYDKSELPHLTIWKAFQKRHYILAVEPGTCRAVIGRAEETKQGRALFLEADESLSVTLEFGIIEGV